MNIIAILEDFNYDAGCAGEWYTEMVHQFREQSGADYLVNVMMGDFMENSKPAVSDKYSRARMAVEAGVDLVLEIPICAGLSDLSTKLFSDVSMLKRLYSVDHIGILCRGPVGGQIARLGKIWFMAPPAYQAELKKLRNVDTGFVQEDRLLTAQIQALEKVAPDIPVAQILTDPINRKAVEIVKAMYQFYWVISPTFVDVEKLNVGKMQERRGENEKNGRMMDAALAQEIHRMLIELAAEGQPEERLIKQLEDTPDGMPELCKQIEEKLDRLREEKSFEVMVAELAGEDLSINQVRSFLLKLLLGMERGNVIICGLRANCPHGRILGIRDESASGYRRIKENTWIPLLMEPMYDGGRNREQRSKLDDCGQMLAELDDRAHELYRRIMLGKQY